VNDQGDHGKKEKQVDQKTGHMVDEESARPKQKQNHKQSQKRADSHSTVPRSLFCLALQGHSIIARWQGKIETRNWKLEIAKARTAA
jgi:hypothetical protein